MKITAIIPARGGSKRLPRKNIFPIWGKPLLSWSIQAAQKSKLITDVWVTTEDKEIASIAARSGASIHKRNPNFAFRHPYRYKI